MEEGASKNKTESQLSILRGCCWGTVVLVGDRTPLVSKLIVVLLQNDIQRKGLEGIPGLALRGGAIASQP
jgi:hypothetical protein